MAKRSLETKIKQEEDEDNDQEQSEEEEDDEYDDDDQEQYEEEYQEESENDDDADGGDSDYKAEDGLEEGVVEEPKDGRKRVVMIRVYREGKRAVTPPVVSDNTLCCQADGCGVNLTVAKRYHRRHRVCEPHAKAAIVSVGDVDQRFCQQCSRFHETSQFDGTKRSCRERLAGHNKRRRKAHPNPQPENGQSPSIYEMKISSLKAIGCPDYDEITSDSSNNID